MSTSFTTIESIKDMQNHVYWDELVLAFNERAFVSGVGGNAFTYPPTDGTDFTYVSTPSWGIFLHACIFLVRGTLTSWVQDNNETYDPTGDSNINIYGEVSNVQEDFFTAAGMKNTAGWYGPRWARVYDPDVNDWTDLDDPMYTQNEVGGVQYDGGIGLSYYNHAGLGTYNEPVPPYRHIDFAYGRAHDEPFGGDIFGPWIIDDIQRMLSTMKWTVYHTGDAEYYDTYKVDGDGSDTDCATARAECEADYGAPDWESEFGSPSRLYRVNRSASTNSNKSFSVFRRKHSMRYTLDSNSPSYDWEFYVNSGGDLDLDGTGWPINDTLGLVTSGSEGAGGGILALGPFGAYDTFPHDLAPAVNCPLASDVSELFAVNGYGLIMKWNFTNSN